MSQGDAALGHHLDQVTGAELELNPDLMYSRGLTSDDVVNAIQAQNIQVAVGNIGGEPAHPKTEFQLTLNTKGRLVQCIIDLQSISLLNLLSVSKTVEIGAA